MPIATPEVYAQMLDRAKERGYAYPAINVTSSQTLNAALRGFADAESDGIVQVSTGGAQYLSGAVKDMVTGSAALASFARSACPITRRNCRSASSIPAAVQRSAMSPDCQCLTLRELRRTHSIIGSHGLVASVRFSAPLIPRRGTVTFSSRPSRSDAAAPG